jgi:hypothetical protein
MVSAAAVKATATAMVSAAIAMPATAMLGEGDGSWT